MKIMSLNLCRQHCQSSTLYKQKLIKLSASIPDYYQQLLCLNSSHLAFIDLLLFPGEGYVELGAHWVHGEEGNCIFEWASQHCPGVLDTSLDYTQTGE